MYYRDITESFEFYIGEIKEIIFSKLSAVN